MAITVSWKSLAFCTLAEDFDIFAKRVLITLQGEDIIGFLGDDRDNRAFDRPQIDQGWNGGNLVGFCIYLDLREHQTLTRCKSRRSGGGAPSAKARNLGPLPRQRVSDFDHHLHTMATSFGSPHTT